MDSAVNGAQSAAKSDDEKARFAKRAKLKQANLNPIVQGASGNDPSSIKYVPDYMTRVVQGFVSEAPHCTYQTHSPVPGSGWP
jgi:hypothetical protein